SRLYPERQSLRLESRGKALSDDVKLNTLTLNKQRILYCKDLGPQIGWKTVFLCEYFGPLVCYLISYSRPALLYGSKASTPMHDVVHLAALCWSFHYLKRLYETLFVHRFSHSTMPIMNLFKNCGYYWGFAFYIGYYVNHPLYTSPYFGKVQIYTCLAGFLLSEIGNYSIHIALRDLRPPGSTERKIPMPTSNPLTFLFRYVSCPNYSYEVYSWAFFTLMTQCLPAGLFAVAGFYQMAVWALGKHRNYKKEFPKYPKGRKAIIPFLI
ncbi:unnamed protein product, partial [Sphagnum jensenii]